jgi:hypothetical protein
VFLREIRGAGQVIEDLRHTRRIRLLLNDRQNGANRGFGGCGINV